ncbi:ankyrin repeat-containing protein, partial [Legionella nautarum]
MPAQVKLIISGNRLLGNKGLSFQLNSKGVCAGLASLYIQYFFEGRAAEFFRLSKLLASPPNDYEIGQDANFDKFIQEVEITFNPNRYNKNTAQGDIEKTITIDGEFVQNEYNLGLVDNEIEWAKILEQIRNNGRACYVGSHNHAVALAFENDQYVLFDPNYDEDEKTGEKELKLNIKTFNSAAETITELTSCFSYKSSDLGLNLRVFARPNAKTNHNYPDKSKIWATRLNDQADFNRAVTPGVLPLNSTIFAILANDTETLHYVLDQNQIKHKEILCAVEFHRDEIVWKYFVNLIDYEQKIALLKFTANYGTTSLLNRMLVNIEKTVETGKISEEEFKLAINSTDPSLFEHAALSNNLGNVVAVSQLYTKYSLKLDSLGVAKRLFRAITETGSEEVLSFLTKTTSTLTISYKRALLMIREAALKGNTSTLQFWLKTIAELEAKSEAADESKDKLPVTVVQKKAAVLTPKIMAVITPYNLKEIIKSEIPIKPELLHAALENPNSDVFKIAVQKQDDNEWTRFLRAVVEDQPLDEFAECTSLFDDHTGISAFEVLARFGKFTHIRNHWPEGLNGQAKENALKFACRNSSSELIRFLVNMGCEVSEEFKAAELKLAAANGDRQRVEAILATKISLGVVFPKTAKGNGVELELLTHLIDLNKHRFITDGWLSLDKKQQKLCLKGALRLKNYELLENILNRLAQLNDNTLCHQTVLEYFQATYKHKQPSYLVEVTPLIKLLNKEDLTNIWRRIGNLKLFKKDPAKYNEFIGFIVRHAILNHNFDLAERTIECVSLSKEHCYDLFVEASRIKNQRALDFLTTHYGFHLTNPTIYKRLNDEGHLDLLEIALGLSDQLPNRELCFELLANAVAKHNKKIVSRLRSFINDYHRVTAAPLFKALSEQNVTGVQLLIAQGASLNEVDFPARIFSLALTANSEDLFLTALKNKEFKAYFTATLSEKIEEILAKGRPNLVYALALKIQIGNYYEQFMAYAIQHNDTRLFQILRQMDQYTVQDKTQLFLKACVHQSIDITNEILRDPIDLDDVDREEEFAKILAQELPFKKTMQHMALGALFGHRSAHEIYDLVYKNALNRLYLYVKEHNFPSALSSIYRSVDELIFDPGLMSKSQLREGLIIRALGEGNTTVLTKLIQSERPPLSDGGLQLFTNYIDQPLVRKILLEHYNLVDVITAAIDDKEWQTVLALIIDLKQDKLDEELLSTLSEFDTELMDALAIHAKRELASDPRHKLNALLVSESTEVLAAVLQNKKTEIGSLIMSIQEQMVDEDVDLKRHFYEFDRYNQFVKEQEALEAIRPRVTDFFSKKLPFEMILDDYDLSTEIREIKVLIEKNNLVPGYFEERDSLVEIFDELDRVDEEARKRLEDEKRREEAERMRLEQEKEVKRLEDEKRQEQERQRMEDEERQEEERKRQEQERQRLEDE